jgi:hypothetical protein
MGAGLWPHRTALGARGWLCLGLCNWCWLGLSIGGVVVVMKCCDRNCNQGRNCPLRIVDVSQPSIFERLFRRFSYWLLIAVLGVLWMAFVAIVVATYA